MGVSTKSFSIKTVAANTDWIAAYLSSNPLAPGQWSPAVDGMDGLNSYHDPNTQASGLRINNVSVTGNEVTTASVHSMPAGKRVFFNGSSLSGEDRLITSVTANTITFDGAPAAATATCDVCLFPDYFHRTLPCEDEAGGGMLDWNAHFLYDPVTGLHTIGAGVGGAASYDDSQYKTWRIRYDPRTNRWYKLWNPLGRGTGHHYGSNAMDQRTPAQGGTRRYWRQGWMFSLDDELAAPTALSGVSPTDGLTFHEGLERLYTINISGRVSYWTEATGWVVVGTHGPLELHSVGAYLSAQQTAVLGGGNSPTNKFCKVGPDGTLSALDDIPAELIPVSAGGSSTMLLDVGFSDRLVLLQDFYDSASTQRNPRPGIWWLKPNAPSGQQWERSPDSLAPVLTNYGGVKREIAAFALRHLGVALVMRYWPSGTLDAVDPASRRCTVYLYRPTPS